MSQWRPVGGEIRPGASLRQTAARRGRARRGGGAGGSKQSWRGPFGWNKWTTAAAGVGGAIALFVVLVVVVAAQLPDPSRVQVHAGEVKIFDHTGTQLVADVSGGGERSNVALNQISPHLQHATVAAEDRHFY